MDIKDALEVCRVCERVMLNLGRRRKFGGSMKRGRWVFDAIPFDRPAMKPGEVAELLNLSKRYIERLCFIGNLRAWKIGRQWRIEHVNAMHFIVYRLQGDGKWYKPWREVPK